MKRKEKIRNKAEELGQKFFPDSANIWARANIEAEYVESACIEMVKWADEHPNWISVEERLPENDDYILMYNGSFNEIHFGTYNDGVFEDYLGPFSEGIITYWMPIVPPKTKE